MIESAFAQTLAAVSPPTDWTGVAFAVVIGLLIFLPIAYAIYVKVRPGKQLGEEELERIAERIYRKQAAPVVAAPLTYDGRTFADQATLDKYKEAKAFVESIPPGPQV
jgi:hypothetical protein